MQSTLLLFTGRNEVVAKVMFLQVCVCPQGGGCLPQCMLGCHTPPRWSTPPRWRTPPDGDPPGWRTPPDGEPPPRKQTPAYGLRAAGTHPTGMHSCLIHAIKILFNFGNKVFAM